MDKTQSITIDDIRKPVRNSFDRVGFDYKEFLNHTNNVTSVQNWISGETCETHILLAACIRWVYDTALAFERGDYRVKISDFDRIKLFVLEEDSNAYMTCLD